VRTANFKLFHERAHNLSCHRFFRLIVACFVSGCVSASEDIACEMKQRTKFDGSPYFECHLNEVVISNPDTKFSGASDELVTEVYANNERDIEFLPIDIVDVFPKVREINFQKTSLKAVTKKSLHGLGELSVLSLVGGSFSSIDGDVFDDLVNLGTLSLARNKLTSLPAIIFSKLENLENLYLDRNQLTSLDPHIFQNNRKLENIDLGRNKLTTFEPGTFDSLSQYFWHISLKDNKIAALDTNWFKNSYKMKHIDVAGNQISEIPQDFLVPFPLLTQVHFSHNPISTVDFRIFGNNKELSMIRFDDAGITKIQNIDVVDQLPKLQLVSFGQSSASCMKGVFRYMKDALKEQASKCSE
jgi:hypothetical protein